MRTLAAVVPVLLTVLPAQDDAPDAMQHGPALMTTFEGGGRTGTTCKGLVVKLGDRGAIAFDTELLRVAAAWTDGWLRLRGTAYDGSHGPMPSLRGHKVFETRPTPGWANGGSFADPRAIPYGPLPREHGRYRGMWLHGDQVIVGYRVGDMDVREGYAIDGRPPLLWVRRTLELGPSKVAQSMIVLEAPEDAIAVPAVAARAASLEWRPKAPGLVEMESSTTGYDRLSLGGPSAGDYLDAASGTGATIAYVPGFATPAVPRAAAGKPAGSDAAAAAPPPLPLPKLHDGVGAADAKDRARAVWFERYKKNDRTVDDGRFVVDLQRAVDVTRVHTYTWHETSRAVQQYELYGRADDEAPDAAAEDPAKAGWQPIARVDSGKLGAGDLHVVAIAKEGGIGRFRHLLFVVTSGTAPFSEIDVWADRFRAPIDAAPRGPRLTTCALTGDAGPELAVDGARVVLRVPPHDGTLRIALHHAAVPGVVSHAGTDPAPAPLPSKPGKARWGEAIVTKGELGAADGPFAVDTITIPLDNRFHSRMRTGAFDFFRDGRAAVSTWNGDVWIVSGIDGDLDRLEWRRFATGLFDPLGLRIVNDVVHVHGRDGITRLHDENGDGEADWYECFNNEVYITPAFHEFAFDLQTDAEGNFYFSKGAPVNPGGRGFMKIVPHHGAILRVSHDGSRLETIATGLRAPNGIGVSPSGVVTSGDNEGTFMPRCRINWIEKPGFYAGVKDTAHRTPVPDQPDLPLCWLPMEVDNSSGGQVWVPADGPWQDLAGRMLHLSYGTCSTYLVLPERVDGSLQGGVVRLPASFSSSCMRGRFGVDGELYVIGLQGWQTSAAKEGGFHRVRRTQAPLGLPVALRTCDPGVYVTFAEPLDAATAADAESWSVEIWNYVYSGNYGSPEVSLLHPERKVEQGKPNRDALRVTAATLSPDRRTVRLAVDGMRPAHQMKITWNVDAADGRELRGELHNSIHVLGADSGFPQER
jgi:hypothetical protein